jgi:hypothetical protein
MHRPPATAACLLFGQDRVPRNTVGGIGKAATDLREAFGLWSMPPVLKRQSAAKGDTPHSNRSARQKIGKPLLPPSNFVIPLYPYATDGCSPH